MSLKPFQLFEIPFYHKLAKLIYGSNFHQLQGELINNLKGKNILVIGPGNGDFLQYLDTKIKYTFIEKSKTFSLQLQKKIFLKHFSFLAHSLANRSSYYYPTPWENSINPDWHSKKLIGICSSRILKTYWSFITFSYSLA